MRRVFSLSSLVFLAFAVPTVGEVVVASPAAAAACQPGETVHLTSNFNPNPTSPGTSTVNTVKITNCTNQTQNVTFNGNIFGPSNCPPGTSFGPIPATIAPNKVFTSKTTFPAPSCKGTYTENIQVFKGTTKLASKRVTFVVA